MASFNLTTGSSSVGVSDPVLAAAQYAALDVVSINETFNLTMMIVDKISQVQIGNIQWANFTWSAAVSLYTSLQYQGNGSLIVTTSSTIVVDTTARTITATNLAINATGMYVIQVQITSSDNQFSIPFNSTGILVKENSSIFFFKYSR